MYFKHHLHYRNCLMKCDNSKIVQHLYRVNQNLVKLLFCLFVFFLCLHSSLQFPTLPQREILKIKNNLKKKNPLKSGSPVVWGGQRLICSDIGALNPEGFQLYWTCCSGRLWSLLPWRYSRPIWTRTWATCSREIALTGAWT